MSQLDELRGRVRAISVRLNTALRTEASNPALAGWGQFLDSTSLVHQIGPYGTASGLVVNQIAFPDAPVDNRVKAQLRAFWDEKATGKLFPQNVRLAFTILALARSVDPELVQLRNEVMAELRGRQLDDGSWSDAGAVGGTAVSGQSDATAWGVLALKRVGGADDAVERGARWLASRIQGSGSVDLVSDIGIAAAVLGHPEPSKVPGLRTRGFSLLRGSSVSREELISFFDFERLQGEESIPMRDYLCFPAFYPIAILIHALAAKASFLEAVQLDAYRTSAVVQLIQLTDGNPYKLPTARFSSLVDQAIYALAYEQLAAAEELGSERARRVAPIYNWSRNSLVIHLGLPILLAGAAVVTVAEPDTVPAVLKAWFGAGMDPLVKFANAHKSEIRIATAFLLTILPSSPTTGLRMLRDKVLRR